MRLASFARDGGETYGIEVPGGIADLGPLLGDRYPDLCAVLRADALPVLAEAAAGASADLPLSEVAWLPVLGPPSTMICIGYNYMDHIREMNGKIPEVPSLFIKLHGAFAGHEQPVFRPRVSDAFDFEGELAVVIGKGGRYIDEAGAMAHVAGYTILNDGSIRDFQAHNVCAGKNFPQTSGYGPFLVTAEEIADPHALTVRTRLNGETVQDGTTADMVFKIPALIAYVSQFMALAPGDVISTGSPHGVGHGRTPKLYMKPGDVIEVEIEGVGLLRNTVEQEA